MACNGTIKLNKDNLLTLLQKNPQITQKEIVDYFNVPLTNIQSKIRVRKKNGIVDRDKSKKSGEWIVKK